MKVFKSKHLILPILLGFSLIFAGFGLDQAGAQALDNCPYPPFSSTETGKPNILIILDHSGSMGSQCALWFDENGRQQQRGEGRRGQH
jgi:hypothetical protein